MVSAKSHAATRTKSCALVERHDSNGLVKRP
jgi:hypothetical protein